MGTAPFVPVWKPPASGPYSRNIWAPELHHLRGRWYIYFAADDGRNENHRMFVLEGDAVDPQRPFSLKGKVASADDHWAIDGTVLQMPTNELYFIWSGWEGTNNVAQNLYIAPLANPWTISGPRVRISHPERDWEAHGTPRVNEGPEVLWHGTNLFVIYSASGSWTDHYCLGQLRFGGGSVMEPSSWVKHPSPVFSQNEVAWGPGHASFVKSPDGLEDWIVYHAAQWRGSGWKRDIRVQPFGWNPDSTPNFGQPISPGTPLPMPAGTERQ
jgi:GH43 family beta-xylosidase